VTYSRRDWSNGEAWDQTAADDWEGRIQSEFTTLTNDSRFPSSGEKSALVGTQGTPGSGNKFVTNVDGRLVYISVTAPPYSATGNGTTDDLAAVQAAIDAGAATHGVVYFPPGFYALSGALKLHRNSRILGGHTPAWMPGAYVDRWTTLVAKSGFSDTALIQVWDNRLTGDSNAPNGGSITGIGLNGAGIATNGLYFRGQSFDWTVENVEAFGCTGAGFRNSGYGPSSVYGNQQEVNYFHCHAWGNANGWYMNDHSYDHRLVACVAHTNSGDGFVLDTGCASIEFANNRAEWNSGTGFTFLSGDKVTAHGCITDSNSGNGFFISYTAGGPCLLSGCYTNRDVTAGIRLNNTNLTVIDGHAGRIGVNDDGSGTPRPVYGIDVTGTSKAIAQGCFAGQTLAAHSEGAGGQVFHWSGTSALNLAGVITYQLPN
jgi:hypothetical protein